MFAHFTVILPSQSLQEMPWVSRRSWTGCRRPPGRSLGWINKALMTPPWISAVLTAAILKCRGFPSLAAEPCANKSALPLIPLDEFYHHSEGPHYWLKLKPSSTPISAERGGCGGGQRPLVVMNSGEWHVWVKILSAFSVSTLSHVLHHTHSYFCLVTFLNIMCTFSSVGDPGKCWGQELYKSRSSTRASTRRALDDITSVDCRQPLKAKKMSNREGGKH